MARRQASAPAIPARRRRRAEAAVAKPPAPPTPEQIQRVKQHAARQVVAEMQAAINQAIAEEQQDWFRDTGRPMPMNLRQLVIEAGVVGVSTEDISLAQERAEKTGDRFGCDEVKDKIAVANILRDQRIEDETRTRLAVAKQMIEPGGVVAASENGDADNSVRSTRKKRHELPAKVVELTAIIAKDKQVEPRRILAEVHAMSHEQLSRALLDECDFKISGKSVKRWRDDVKNQLATARSMGPLEPADDEDDVEVSLGEARQHGLSPRSRIDGITKLGADRRR